MNDTPAAPGGTTHTSAAQSAELVVPGMGSDRCAGIISASLERLDGVESVRTSVASHKLTVRFDPESMGSATLKAAIERASYHVAGVSEPRDTRRTEEVRPPAPSGMRV